MCGIAGAFSHRGNRPVHGAQLEAMNDLMSHRGPDAEGIWVSENGDIGLAHRRLAIIDLSPLGVQPMHSLCKRYTIVFNGEIYNFAALRDALEQKAYQFRSCSDTEVLLALFAEYGEQMCTMLRGMYAFAIWDQHEKKLFMARDPYGIKPLYYSNHEGVFQFASQVKALLAGNEVDRSWNPAGLVSFFVWGHPSTPHTIYKGVTELHPGYFMWVTEEGPEQPKRFQSIGKIFSQAETFRGSHAEMGEILGEALRDSVQHHLVSDVPVGLFLSAGLDSCSLLSLMSEFDQSPTTLTLGFKEFKDHLYDEVPAAELASKSFGSNHMTMWIDQKEFMGDAEDIIQKMDQPSIDGLNTYLVSKYARKAGFTVALSGLGGDELFGGYPSFSDVPKWHRRLRIPSRVPGFGTFFRSVSYPFLRSRTSPKYSGVFEYGKSIAEVYLLRRSHWLPHELVQFLDADLVREGWDMLSSVQQLKDITKDAENDHGKLALLEAQWYMRAQLLRDSDWASMAHSIELRVPFVDIELFTNLAPLIKSHVPPRKIDMAKSLKRSLPSEVLSRPKSGFSVPIRDWMMASDQTLSDRSIRGLAKFVSRRFNLPASW